jgi:hypothetical protein
MGKDETPKAKAAPKRKAGDGALVAMVPRLGKQEGYTYLRNKNWDL